MGLIKRPRPAIGHSVVLAVPFVLAIGITACEKQDPAFKENVGQMQGNGDSTAAKKNSVKAIAADGSIESETHQNGDKADGKTSDKTDDQASDKTGQPVVQDPTPAAGSEVLQTDPPQVASADPSPPVSTPAPAAAGKTPASKVDGKSDPFGAEGGIGAEGGLNVNWKVVEFTQGGAGKVDILWIVDTSGSMSPEQAYLATNFNLMINALNDAGHDFQTAITTTDVCQNTMPANLSERVCPANYGGSPATHLRGSFVGQAGRKVLKKGDADLIQKFNTYTLQGVDGSGFEHGLEAAHLAIQKVIGGQNENLIRSDAFLAIIVVSDEEDDGIGLGMRDAYNGHNFVAEGLTTFKWSDDDMISYLQTVKGQGNFSISAITGTRLPNGSMCSAPHTQPLEEGTQYINAAKKTGGLLQSICDTNWSKSLTNLGVDLNSQITQVTLPSTPDPATIKVKANDVITSEWTYNEANNAIKFNVGHVPPEGTKVYVGYVEK